MQMNECLRLAATGHTQDMVANNFFSHTGSNGSTMEDRICRAYGEPKIYGKLGENCGRPKLFEGPEFAKIAVMRNIVDEGVPGRGHRLNIYDKDYRYVGIHMRWDDNYEGYLDTFNFSSVDLQPQQRRELK